ncbi:MAG TPA: tRNA (adenosine(37)-N6)-dimethylallyltransferase MiaA [Candidatus Limnocylindria bacterium]|nr:tRNA (adenosine(37)-N6)-dimethylallyltransferase MiaA [Candidatus Limnocylindria bacterium]
MTRPRIGAIVGPTASGKSALALAIARRLPLEIISADSRQVYRGMDVGTAKPTAAERAAVRHHLLDVAAPDEPFSVADWVARARSLVDQISGRGNLPLVVGGTGLYVSALVDGFDFDAQAWSPQIRARLAAELESAGLAPLAERLRLLVPAVAARIDLRNSRRVLRALERAEAGDPAMPQAEPYAGTVRIVGIRRPADVLARRIEARARAMFGGGLLDETRALLAAGHDTGQPALSGHGYAEAAGVLAGTTSVDEAVASTSRRVRQYARRQMTWFDRDARIEWLDAGDSPSDRPALVEAALAHLTG